MSSFAPTGCSEQASDGSSHSHLTCPCPAALQYYFETIFPRIPKKVQDDIVEGLQARGLPTTGKGNGGAGGPDRRGADDGNRRPPSVKASLSVAFGQRAPNRAGARDDRVREALKGSGQDAKADHGRSDSRRRSPLPPADDYGNGRGASRERPRSKERSRERQYDSHRDGRTRDYRNDRPRHAPYDPDDRPRHTRYDRDERPRHSSYDRAELSRESRDRDREPRYPRSRSRDRDRGNVRRRRSPSLDRGHSAGRNARDVFRESAADVGRQRAADEIKSRYGDASGKAEGSRGEYPSKDVRSAEEVFRLGDKYRSYH